MKKTITTLLTLLALLTIVAGGFVSFASANPIWMAHMGDPNAIPSIAINNPIQNATFNVSHSEDILNVPLNFTINKPTYFCGPIVSVWYTLNGSGKFYINVTDYDSKDNTNYLIKQVSPIRLGCGVYNVTVGLDAKSYYATADHNWHWISVIVHAKSEPITITLNPPPTPAPTVTPTPQIQNQPVTIPTEYALLICLAVAAILAPILFFRKHRKNR
jgi:hypothetical protein